VVYRSRRKYKRKEGGWLQYNKLDSKLNFTLCVNANFNSVLRAITVGCLRISEPISSFNVVP
jgi:hypothetical protein